MSLYNALFGFNPFARVYLAMANISVDETGRFRDCYLRLRMGFPQVVVFTRNGGGNREEYQGVIDDLRARPNYVEDFDDGFDPTYASFAFTIPESTHDAAMATIANEMNEMEPMQKFRKLLEKLQAKEGTDPDVQRALEIGREAFGKINAALSVSAPNE